MTETSYLWDGLVTGDATLAPYNKTEFNKYIFGAYVEDSEFAFVIPGYLNDLEVVSTGGYAVSVSTGAALLQQQMYINSSPLSLSIDQVTDPTYFRFDYIALQLDQINQTLRAVVLKGLETNDYTLLENPALIQTGAFWQAPIARLFVDGSETSILAENIHDYRKFAVTTYTTNTFTYNQNLIQNSEFMAWSVPGTNNPSKWVRSGVAGDSAVAAFGSMVRGQAWSLPASSGLVYNNTDLQAQFPVCTVKGSFYVATGDASELIIGLSNASVTVPTTPFITKKYTRLEVGDIVEFQFTCRIPTTNPTWRLAVSLRSNGGIHYIGQIILVPGYHPGPYRQMLETLPLLYPITDANWTNTAKSTSTTTIDFTATFGSDVLRQTKAVVLRLRGRDSGSAAGAPYMRILGYSAAFPIEYGRLDLEGVTNDVYRETTCICPVGQPIYAAQSQIPQLRIDIVATGAATFDATVEVIGIIT